MPVLSDFVIIRRDDPIRIGDGATTWAGSFNTGGRHSNTVAFLILKVKGLTATDHNIYVFVNNMSGQSTAMGAGMKRLKTGRNK